MFVVRIFLLFEFSMIEFVIFNDFSILFYYSDLKLNVRRVNGISN